MCLYMRYMCGVRHIVSHKNRFLINVVIMFHTIYLCIGINN